MLVNTVYDVQNVGVEDMARTYGVNWIHHSWVVTLCALVRFLIRSVGTCL